MVMPPCLCCFLGWGTDGDDNGDGDGVGGVGISGGGVGQAGLVIVVVVVVLMLPWCLWCTCALVVAWCRLPGSARHSPILISR